MSIHTKSFVIFQVHWNIECAVTVHTFKQMKQVGAQDLIVPFAILQQVFSTICSCPLYIMAIQMCKLVRGFQTQKVADCVKNIKFLSCFDDLIMQPYNSSHSTYTFGLPTPVCVSTHYRFVSSPLGQSTAQL